MKVFIWFTYCDIKKLLTCLVNTYSGDETSYQLVSQKYNGKVHMPKQIKYLI